MKKQKAGSRRPQLQQPAMEIFISWSGQTAGMVAEFLRKKLPNILPNVVAPFLSSIDIRAGKTWSPEIQQGLRKANFGIICVTKNSIDAPWVLFEAGALSKLKSSQVCPFLIGFGDDPNRKNVKGPLGQFMVKDANEAGTRELLTAINEASGHRKITEAAINESYNAWFWKQLKGLLDQLPDDEKPAPWGIRGIYNGQVEVDRDFSKEWKALYRDNVKQLDVLGHTNNLIMKRRDALLAVARNEGAVRIIVLNPFLGLHQQFVETARLINWKFQDTEILASKDTLSRTVAKVLETVQFVMEAKRQLAAEGKGNAINIRFAADTMYHSITRADERMIVSHYLSSTREQGQTGPTFVLEKDGLDGKEWNLFRRHSEEFESVWKSATPIEGAKTRSGSVATIARHLDTVVNAYLAAVHYQKADRIPLPACAIVFPTYKCTDADGQRPCGYCTYGSMGMAELSTARFRTIAHILCADANGPRVKALELSGGGEPTQHSDFPGILKCLSEIRGVRPEIQLGLLTNGLELQRFSADLGVFNYIRVNVPEALYAASRATSGREGAWWSYVDAIREIKSQHAKVRLGVKLLVSKENAGFLHELVQLFHDEAKVEHLKIKPICTGEHSPDREQVDELVDKLGILKATTPGYDDLVVDVNHSCIPTSHKCWITAVFTVVDPRGIIHKCCNYGMYPHQTPVQLGKFPASAEEYVQMWRSPEHLALLQKVDVKTVCRMCNAAECRFFEYQSIVEGVLDPFLGQLELREERPQGDMV